MWFAYVVGFLSVVTVACLYLHQYHHDDPSAEGFADITTPDPIVIGAPLSVPVPPAEEETSAEAEAEEEASAEAEVRAEEALRPATTTAPTVSAQVLDAIDDLVAYAPTFDAPTPEEEEALAEEEVPAEEEAVQVPPQVLRVIDVPKPIPTKSAHAQDETYAYHPSPLDQRVDVDEPGYVYLPSTFWSVPQKRPPACTPEAKPNVCPVYTDGVPEGALEWRTSARERQLRAAARPATARHRADPDLDYYYPGYYAKGNKYTSKCG